VVPSLLLDAFPCLKRHLPTSYDRPLMTEEDMTLGSNIQRISDIHNRYNPHIQSDPLVIERCGNPQIVT
jgi:hypothetical protein